jgi:phage I-like protein
MPVRQKRTLNLAALSSAFVDLFGEGDAPKREFRIFPRGIVASSKGEFLFDDQAAATVMAAAIEHGADVTVDYDHHTLHTDRGVKAVSAGWFNPAVRDGELWATNVRWNEPALEHFAKKEYRYFSPLFDHDDKGRITNLINCALTNTPALHGLDALVAASATANKETDMTEEEKLRARIAELEKENATLRVAGGTVVALSAMTGLASTAGIDEVRTTVGGLVTLRSKLFELTSKDSVPAALGTVEGWKREAGDAATLKREKEEIEQAGHKRDIDALLDKASTDGKITPAERPGWEKDALFFGGGKPSKDGVAWLSAKVETLVPKPGGAAGDGKGKGGGEPKQPANRVAMSGADRRVAELLRIKETDWQEWDSKRVDRGGA